MTIEVVSAGTRRRVVVAVVGTLVALACVLSSAQAQQRTAPFTLYAPLIVGAQPTAPQGQWSWSAPIAVSADGSVWVVNPDAGSLTQLDTQSLMARAEILVGREPWSLAISPDGATVYVVDRAAGTLVVVDA
ncbi:MAG: hypothetical protein H7Y32_02355, partial [Chloroflexales bacterium]|nr:hypothetical protein [Chloroflexales bacterium]